jgi:hypothetical protein
VPIQVAARPKAWVCVHSLAGIAGSNPAGVMDIFPLPVLCVFSGRGLLDGLITCPEMSYQVVSVFVKPQRRIGLGSQELSIHEDKNG